MILTNSNKKQTLTINLKKTTRVIIFIFLCLIGNAQVNGIDIFLLAAPLYLLTIDHNKTTVNNNMLLVYLITCLLFTAITYQAYSINQNYFNNYGIWPIKTLILIAIATHQLNSIENKREINALAGTILVLFCVSLTATGTYIDGRLYSVFGPNMLYRFFISIAILLYVQGPLTPPILKFILPSILLYFTALTGSTASIVVLTLSSIYLKIITKKNIILILFILFILFITTDTSNFTLLSRALSKILNFNEIERINAWNELITTTNLFKSSSYSDYAYLWSEGFKYPHNIIIELIVFYGTSGILLTTIFFLALLKCRNNTVTHILFIVIFISSNFSGDLSDNYSAIALSFALSFSLLKNKPRQ